MGSGHPQRLRTVAAALAAGVVATAGISAAAIAGQTITLPGTTVALEVEDDGSVNTDSLKSQLPPGATLPEGFTLPKGLVEAAAAAAASGLIPTTPTQAEPSAATTPTTPPASSIPTTPPAATATPPAPTGASPIPGLPSLGGPATTTATTTAASNKTADTLATLLLIAFGGLLLALGLAWAGLRLAGADPEWLASARHRSGEAAWRASAGWADFRDWLRSPR